MPEEMAAASMLKEGGKLCVAPRCKNVKLYEVGGNIWTEKSLTVLIVDAIS